MTSDPSPKIPETPFGVRLRAARKMAGMSLEDLAAKLGGRVTKQALSKYETGRMMPSPEVLEKLVEVLKIATWGASPLKAEDPSVEKQLAFESPMLLGESVRMRRAAFRRPGILRRLLKDRGSLPEELCENSLVLARSRVSEEGWDRSGEGLDPLADRRARYLSAWHSDASVNEIKFRAGEKLAAKTESALKYRVADHLRRYQELESILGTAAEFDNPVAGQAARTDEEVEDAAAAVRRRWDLGQGPVVNLLGLLEDKGIKVYEVRGIEGFEGLSGRFGSRPFVAVSLDFPADRVRFTAAHELGHVLCGFSGSENPESRCHAFGAAFLLPSGALEKAFAGPRRKVTMGDLGEIKVTYGVSLQAIMYRARARGFVSDRQLRSFRETVKARGWAVEEPVAYRGHERATRFRRLLHRAVAAGIMDVARAAELGGLPAGELEKDIGEIF